MPSNYLVIPLLVLLLLLPAVAAEAKPSAAAEARTSALIAAFEAVVVPKEGASLTAEEKTKNDEAFVTLDGFFELDQFVASCIEPSKGSFDAETLESFKETFKALVRLVAYPDSGDFLRQATKTMSSTQVGPSQADVAVELVLAAEDMETTVTFHWFFVDGVYKVRDVSFDGDSLVKEYQNQFKRIIKKKGVQGLMDRLKAKYAEVTGGGGA